MSKKHIPGRRGDVSQEQSKSDRTREKLITCAISLFAETGEKMLSISEVARRAKITRQAAYYHFRNREQLLDAVHAEVDEQLQKFSDGSMEFGNRFTFIPGLAAEDADIVRSRVFQMLEDGAEKSAKIQATRKTFEDLAARGCLRPGVDPDMAALIAVGYWFSATLAISLAKTKKAKHELAVKFGDAIYQSMFYGLVDPESDEKWSKPPSQN